MSDRTLTSEEVVEFRHCTDNGLKLLGITSSTPSLASVEAVEVYVDNWHKPQGSFLQNYSRASPIPLTLRSHLALFGAIS